MRTDQLALQLYTIRDACAADFLGTLREVAAMGYRAVELAGLHGVAPDRLRAALDELGISAVSAHVGLDRFEGDLGAVARELRALGCGYAVVPWVPDALRTPDFARELAAKLNAWGASLAGEGIRVAYHNHDFEFRPVDGVTMWEQLAAGTDPALVDLELDLFWAAFAGYDPAAVLAQYAGRVALVHLKDMAPDGKTYVAAGTGTLDWGAIIPAADAAGARWFITEVDSSPDPMESARVAYRLMAERASA
jgi:sugar phosphate isomerase/epimerase